MFKKLSFIKDIEYEELIDYIINNKSHQSLGSIITRELRDFLLK